MAEERMIVHHHDPDGFGQRTFRVGDSSAAKVGRRFHLRLDGQPAGFLRVKAGGRRFPAGWGFGTRYLDCDWHGIGVLLRQLRSLRFILQMTTLAPPCLLARNFRAAPRPARFSGMLQRISAPPLGRCLIWSSPPTALAR